MMLSLLSLYLVTKQLIPEFYICSLAFEDHIVQVLVAELLPSATLTRTLSTPLLQANNVQMNPGWCTWHVTGRVGWQSRLKKMAGILTTGISTLVSTKLGHFKQTPENNLRYTVIRNNLWSRDLRWRDSRLPSAINILSRLLLRSLLY